MIKVIRMTILSTIFCMTTVGMAQQQAPLVPNPDPCPDGSGFDDFDFWVGEWTVTTMDGKTFLGENEVTKVADGCLLLENWMGIQNAKGNSMNYYNPLTKKWRQFWVDNAGYSIDYEGTFEDGKMTLEGLFFTHKDGSSLPFKGEWTPLEGGDVRQTFYMKNEGEWVVNWDARYSKKISRANESESKDL